MFKAVLLISAQALLIQSIAGQCIGARIGAAPLGIAGPLAGPYGIAGPLGAPYGLAGPLGAPYGIAGPFGGVAAVPASSGGGLAVSSASPYPASGVSVLSENAIEGALAVAGALPFLGTVALEGALPTAGAGAVNYGCGNGAVGILEETAPAALAAPYGIAGPFGAGPYGIAGPLAGAPCAGAYGARYLI